MIALSARAATFLSEPRLCTLTTLRPDGTPHLVAVRFTWDPTAGVVRGLPTAAPRTVRNLAADPGGRAAVCQVDGFRWITLEGSATVTDDRARIAEGVRRYTERYAVAPPRPSGRRRGRDRRCDTGWWIRRRSW